MVKAFDSAFGGLFDRQDEKVAQVTVSADVVAAQAAEHTTAVLQEQVAAQKEGNKTRTENLTVAKKFLKAIPGLGALRK
jgi:hypothetical protein